jgi:hypothetical protein
MTLANAADGRVAAHLTQGFDVVSQQQGGDAHAGGRQRRLGAGMAAADHNHAKSLGKIHLNTRLAGVCCSKYSQKGALV